MINPDFNGCEIAGGPVSVEEILLWWGERTSCRASFSPAQSPRKLHRTYIEFRIYSQCPDDRAAEWGEQLQMKLDFRNSAVAGNGWPVIRLFGACALIYKHSPVNAPSSEWQWSCYVAVGRHLL